MLKIYGKILSMNAGQTEYDATLDRLYSYVDYSMVRAEAGTSAVFSLARISDLLSRLGNPQNAFKSIHVAGTKGKGSVCALIYSTLIAAGYSVGLYTSPHLICFNERIQQNGRMISDRDVIEIGNQVMDAMDPEHPASTFDIMTAMAFLYFKKKKIQIAVIETGLGGRLDSTNVIMPFLTVITPVSLDHTAFLGNTIPEITAEKAGIIKEGIPLVTGQTHQEALPVLRSAAELHHAEMIDVFAEYIFRSNPENSYSQTIEIAQAEPDRTDGTAERFPAKFDRFNLRLIGDHQVLNAVIAYAALKTMVRTGFYIPTEAIENGFRLVFWPCRFELIHEAPQIVLDGAHNRDSIEFLIRTIREVYPDRQVTFIFGVSEDKPYEEMLEKIVSQAKRIILTRSTHPRSADPMMLAGCKGLIGTEVSVATTLEEALAIAETSSKQDIIIVTGSLFVAGGFRSLWMEKHPSLKYFVEDNYLESE